MLVYFTYFTYLSPKKKKKKELVTVEIKTFFILFLSFGAIQATKSSCHIDDTGSGCKQSRSSSWFDGMIQKRAILEAEKDCSKIAGAVP